jgi:hypothetical protein
VHGKVDAFGILIAVNGWHAIFYLSTGLTGLAVCINVRATQVYAFAAGSIQRTPLAAGPDQTGMVSDR